MRVFRLTSSLCAVVFLACSLSLPALAQTSTSAFNFVSSDRGGVVRNTLGNPNATTTVGYGRIRTNLGSVTPAAIALYELRQNGVLISETGVPASNFILSGRIYQESSTFVDTGVAIANPNSVTAVISFFFTDGSGIDSGFGSFNLAANAQISRFLSEPPFVAPGTGKGKQGTFTFTSNVAIGVVAIQTLVNERGEGLMTTLPVVDTSTVTVGASNVISQFADGGGWATQVILVNSSDVTEAGTLQFFEPGSSTGIANPISLTVNGTVGTGFAYSIPRRSFMKFTTSGLPATTSVGSIWVTANPNSGLPVSTAIFSYRVQGVTVSEAAVPPLVTTRFRMYVESTGPGSLPGTIQTGVAVANTDVAPTSVTFELYRLDGTYTGFAANRAIAGKGQLSVFLHELFPTATFPLQGIVRIISTGPPISAVGLRTRYNERRSFLITTLPPYPELVPTFPTNTAEMLFPQIVESGGYLTTFILFSSTFGLVSSGNVSFYSTTGVPLFLPLQ